MGVRSEKGAVPLPRKFLTFWLEIVHFGAYSDKNSRFIMPIAGLNKKLIRR